jgi:PAP2 superfamily
MQITPNQHYEGSDALPVSVEGLQEALGNVSIGQSPNSHAKLIMLARKALGFFVPTARMGIAWAVVGIFAVTDLIRLQFSKLKIAPNTARQIMNFCIILAATSVLLILLRLCLVILNALVVGSTLTEGGHYLVDVIGGIVVAGASILFIAAVESKRRTISEFVSFAMPRHRTDA